MDGHRQPLGFAAMPVQHGLPEVVFEPGPVRFGILALTDEQASVVAGALGQIHAAPPTFVTVRRALHLAR